MFSSSPSKDSDKTLARKEVRPSQSRERLYSRHIALMAARLKSLGSCGSRSQLDHIGPGCLQFRVLTSLEVERLHSRSLGTWDSQ